MFGNKPFGQSPTSPFGWQPTTLPFGSSSSQAYETPSSSPAFGSTDSQIFGNMGAGFRVSTSPSGFTIQSPTTPPGFTVTITFGAPSAPSFGATLTSSSGAQCTVSRSHASTPYSGGRPDFGGQGGGSRVSLYSSMPEIEEGCDRKLLSISAMPVYKGKSHEELRWEDYQLGDKGGPSSASQSNAAVSFGQYSAPSFNPFSASAPSVTLSPKVTSDLPFGSSSTSAFCFSPVGPSSTSNIFSPTSLAPPLFGSETQTSPFGSLQSLFGTSAQGTTASGIRFNFGNTLPPFIFQSSAEPAFSLASSLFGNTTSSTCGQTRSLFGQSNQSSTTPPFTFGGSTISSSSALLSKNNRVLGQTALPWYKHGADVEALMPKLRHSDYYTVPSIQEIAAKERGEKGYCRQIKDFVVGRHEYGSVKFFGETDVTRLDLEALVQFNKREVIVNVDGEVGQGLNKPAEVTLLNVKCVDKTSGVQCTKGARVEKYTEMLRRKGKMQGAEFVSYDPVKGKWTFRVQHFSRYELGEEDDCD